MKMRCSHALEIDVAKIYFNTVRSSLSSGHDGESLALLPISAIL